MMWQGGASWIHGEAEVNKSRRRRRGGSFCWHQPIGTLLSDQDTLTYSFIAARGLAECFTLLSTIFFVCSDSKDNFLWIWAFLFSPEFCCFHKFANAAFFKKMCIKGFYGNPSLNPPFSLSKKVGNLQACESGHRCKRRHFWREKIPGKFLAFLPGSIFSPACENAVGEMGRLAWWPCVCCREAKCSQAGSDVVLYHLASLLSVISHAS